MGRRCTILLALLLGAGLLGFGLLGPLTGYAPAQSRTSGKAQAGGKAVKAAKADAKDESEESAEDEDAEAKAGKAEPGEAGGVMELLKKRKEAIQGLTRRGQSISQAPPFTVIEREPQLEFYPCGDCHDDQIPNPKVRTLTEEHTELDFNHGGGRFWCYDACHNRKNMNTLVSLHGEPISFNEPYKLCGQCHFQRQKDWYFGGHGKRVGSYPQPRDVPAEHSKIDFSNRAKIGTWRSDKRVLTPCTQCHNAHSPSIKPYEPSPPPQVRRGLSRHTEVPVKHETVWQDIEASRRGGEK